MKILLDMNLSPVWVQFLTEKGFEAVHWSQIGDPKAKDPVIMQWARANDHIVFTHDLGFSALLAAGGENSPFESYRNMRTSSARRRSSPLTK